MPHLFISVQPSSYQNPFSLMSRRVFLLQIISSSIGQTLPWRKKVRCHQMPLSVGIRELPETLFIRGLTEMVMILTHNARDKPLHILIDQCLWQSSGVRHWLLCPDKGIVRLHTHTQVRHWPLRVCLNFSFSLLCATYTLILKDISDYSITL